MTVAASRPATRQVVQLACGCPDIEVGGVCELVALEWVALALDIRPVQQFLQAEALSRLTAATCTVALTRPPPPGSEAVGGGLRGACLAMARREWDTLAASRSFLDVPAPALAEILAADGLQASCEEVVFLGVARWMRGGDGADKGGRGGGLREEGLLAHVRLPLMSPACLDAACGHLPEAARLPEMVAEALALRGGGAAGCNQLELRHLQPACLAARTVCDPNSLSTFEGARCRPASFQPILDHGPRAPHLTCWLCSERIQNLKGVLRCTPACIASVLSSAWSARKLKPTLAGDTTSCVRRLFLLAGWAVGWQAAG